MKPSSVILSFASAVVAQQQTLCKQYASWSGDGYLLNNNLWGEMQATSGSQCQYLDSANSSGVSWHTIWTWEGPDSDVKSYDYSGITVTPVLITSISSMPTTVTWSYNSTSGINADVSYDLFSSSNRTHVTYSGDYELMIWLGKFGSITPIGGSPSQTNITIGNTQWDLYTGGSSTQYTYSFVASAQPLYSWSGDVLDFWTWLANNKGYPASNQYLLNYQFGTEAFTGGPVNFVVDNWSASVH